MDRNHRKSVGSAREGSLSSVLSFTKQHKKSPSDDGTNAELRALRENSMLNKTKKNLIAQRLKKFLAHRPTQDDLYQRNILASPYQTLPPKLSIFYKIQQAFEKVQGSQVEGVFRVSGNSENIRNIWASIAADTPNYTGASAHDIAGVMKMYIRQLQNPLIPGELFQSFVDAQKMEDESHKLAAMKLLLKYLSEDNMLLLRALIIFLERVSQQVAVNKMNAHNLAVCFGPNVLKSPKDGAGVLTDIETQCSVVETMISHRVAIFGESHSASHSSQFQSQYQTQAAQQSTSATSPRDPNAISPRGEQPSLQSTQQPSNTNLKSVAFANLPPPPPAPTTALPPLPPPPTLTPIPTAAGGPPPMVVKKVLGTGRPPAMTAPPPVNLPPPSLTSPIMHALPPPPIFAPPPPILAPPPPLPMDPSFHEPLLPPPPPPPAHPLTPVRMSVPSTPTYIPPADFEEDENEELYLTLLDDLDEADKPALVRKLAGYFTSDPKGFRKFLKNAVGPDGIIAILELLVL